MTAPRLMKAALNPVETAVQAMGTAALNETAIKQHIRPLFSQVLSQSIQHHYFANHSLGRPLDQTRNDVLEGLDLWYEHMDDAWQGWLSEMNLFRRQIASLIHAREADCIVPKASAGQGLRTILNSFDGKIHVLSSKDEFTSIDHILKVYQQQGKIQLSHAEPEEDGFYKVSDITKAITKDVDLIVISLVFFSTGQKLLQIGSLVDAAHEQGAMVMLDLYHVVGAVPVDISRIDADFAIGGSYKYLRGGPGACWLYLHPRHLDGSLTSLDTGWFAQPQPFNFERSAKPQFARGGDRFLESTPAILPFYQARAGLAFTLALGVERLRDYSIQQQTLFELQLSEQNIPFIGSINERGAFVAIPHTQAELVAEQLKQAGVICDAREGKLRFCADCLNTEEELLIAVTELKKITSKQHTHDAWIVET